MKDLVRHPVVLVLAAVVLTLGLVCSLPAHAQAPPPDEATAELRALADQGHAGAQFNLGIIYGAGERVPEHEAEAVRWYRLAADQGHPAAQYRLGLMYGQGRGVPQDDAEAVRWFRLAADRGFGPGAGHPRGHVRHRPWRASGRRDSPYVAQSGRLPVNGWAARAGGKGPRRRGRAADA